MKVGDKVSIFEIDATKVKGPVKKVSAIIPNYNYEKFIIERIDSILNQTYPVSELIILDDASTDNSIQVIKNKMKSIMIPVKLIENKENSNSVFSQWQKGIASSSGDYFWIAEADDSSDPRFLEEAMKGFQDDEVILSYTESARIDGENILTHENSQDLYNMFGSTRWDRAYIHDGEQEIREVLNVTNTILNVSSVVWKKGDYKEILEHAKNFKVAGDWYIYYQLLKMGKIAFSNKPYNYYRKHGSSVSTDVKADVEYKEICTLQEMANREFHLGMPAYKIQRLRRSYMDHNVSKEVRKKKIAWVIPHPGKGSGGHRTIIQNVNALIRHGYECDIYVEEDFCSTSEDVAKKIDTYYEPCAATCYVGIEKRCEYDLVFATGWTTIDFVKYLDVPKKAYFIQDFEPWFFPMGDSYLKTENSYRLDFKKITIGKWLSHKMIEEYHSKSQYFDFCADLDVYHPLPKVKKENAICYIWQPEKPRRCDYLALRALKLVKEMKPDVKIYVYGSDTKNPLDFEAERLGIISTIQCNELYNKCQLGLCMSASNPSRIPFEMMAAGLPVVELYKENNLYDFPTDGIVLAESSEEAIATAIIDLLGNSKKRKEMSLAGMSYMKNYPLSRGFEQFVQAVDILLNEREEPKLKIKQSYLNDAVVPSKKVEEVSKKILVTKPLLDTRSPRRKQLSKCKLFVKRLTKSAAYRIDNLSNKM